MLPSFDEPLTPRIVPLLPLSKLTFPEKSILMAFSLLAVSGPQAGTTKMVTIEGGFG